MWRGRIGSDRRIDMTGWSLRYVAGEIIGSDRRIDMTGWSLRYVAGEIIASDRRMDKWFALTSIDIT